MTISKRNVRDIFILLLVIVSGIVLLTESRTVSRSVSESLKMCGEMIIPSLFPFMVLSSFTVDSGIFRKCERFLSPVMKLLFGLPVQCISAVFFGFIGGFPVGARITDSLLSDGVITKKDAKHLLMFCVNAGPAFVVTAAGTLILGSRQAGIIMLSAVCLSSFAVGIVSSFYFRKGKVYTTVKIDKNINIVNSLVGSVSSSTTAMLSVCAWILVFSAASSIVKTFISDVTALEFIDIFSEVTTGIKSAAAYGGIPLAAACISFGGLCVMCQILPYVRRCGMKIWEYLLSRLTCATLTYLITKILLVIFPVSVSVSAFDNVKVWTYTAPAGAAMLIMGAVLVYSQSEKLYVKQSVQ